MREVRLAALAESPLAFGSTLERELGFGELTWAERTGKTALAWEASTERACGIVGWYWHHEPTVMELVSMWVAPAVRGRGVGEALVSWVVDEARRLGAALELGVVSDNVRAVALYRRMGFEAHHTEVGTLRGQRLLRMRLGPVR